MMLAGLLATVGLYARRGGSGSGGGPGGHGGRGGRSGFSSSRSSGASSGRGVGHAIGHSFGHLFGHHSKAPSSAHDMAPPLAGAAVLHGKVVQLPGPQIVSSPAQPKFHHRPINDFPFGNRFMFFPLQPGFGFGGCAGYGSSRQGFFFDDEFNCFAGGFFFEPFFIAGFSGSLIGSPAFLPGNDQGLDYVPNDSMGAPPAEARPAQPSCATDLRESGGSRGKPASNHAASMEEAESERPVTLLQLRDGSMYGLVDYWVDDGQLHYTTTYGGQNSLGLERIDLEKTLRLNADRGVQFVLRPKTPPR